MWILRVSSVYELIWIQQSLWKLFFLRSKNEKYWIHHFTLIMFDLIFMFQEAFLCKYIENSRSNTSPWFFNQDSLSFITVSLIFFCWLETIISLCCCCCSLEKKRENTSLRIKLFPPSFLLSRKIFEFLRKLVISFIFTD